MIDYQEKESQHSQARGGHVMIYYYSSNGIPVQTGDVICASDGGAQLLAGKC